MSASKILVIDDGPQIQRVLRAALTANEYDVIGAFSGEEGLEMVRREAPDLVLLDLNLPGWSGFETCLALREISNVPIIILSVRDGEDDKVKALDAGASDFMTKPFNMNELFARIRAALRRSRNPDQGRLNALTLGDVTIDFESRCVRSKEARIRLTPKEHKLLSFLVEHAGQPVSHRRILREVWGSGSDCELSYLRVFVSKLRRKIEADPSNPKYILTSPWVGYRFELPPSTPGIDTRQRPPD